MNKSQTTVDTSINVDLYQCAETHIQNEFRLREFVSRFSKFVRGQRFGDAAVIYSGSRQETQGFSVVQLFDDAVLSGRFVNEKKVAHINLVGSPDVSADDVGQFCKDYFRAERCVVNQGA